jgi:hypothetical protein
MRQLWFLVKIFIWFMHLRAHLRNPASAALMCGKWCGKESPRDEQRDPAAFVAALRNLTLEKKFFCLHQSSALTIRHCRLGWLASMAERVGINNM